MLIETSIKCCCIIVWQANGIQCVRIIPYLPVYKSTFEDLKIRTKIRPRLIHGSKLEIQAPVK